MSSTLRCAAENLAIDGRRRAGAVSARLDSTRAQVEPYRRAWWRHNEVVLGQAEPHERPIDPPWPHPGADAPLWVVLGDSAAQGIGASSPFHGWVGQVQQRLGGTGLAILNLSRSGARAHDVLDTQLPALHRLGRPVALVTCVIGGNDMYRSTRLGITRRFEALVRALPEPDSLGGRQRTVLTTIPQGLGRRRAGAANQVVAEQAPQRGIAVADLWATTGPPWQGKFADDFFHPNDTGYADWADAITPVVADQIAR